MPEFTGERVMPGLVDADLYNEHFARYEFAARMAAGKRVLDAGCGAGYGSAELAKPAHYVTAIDSSSQAIAFASENFARPNLNFSVGDCSALPGGPYDLVVAFEVIEHLEDWRTFLQEARRVLSPGGAFLVSTPNRDYYAESRGESGQNPFHVHEFDYPEFQRELAAVFPHSAIYTQNHVEGVAFSPPAPASGDVCMETKAGSLQAAPEEAHFFVAVCSLEPLPPPFGFVWIPGTGNVLRERERHIALLTGEVALKTEWLQRSKSESDSLLNTVRELNQQLEQRNRWALEEREKALRHGARVLALQSELEQEQTRFAEAIAVYEAKTAELEEINRVKTEWAQRTDQELEAQQQQTAECVRLLDSAERHVVERTLWGQGLQRDLEALQSRLTALLDERWVRAGFRFGFVREKSR